MNNNQAKINKAKFELKNGTTQSNKEKEFASQLNNIDNKVNNNVNINVINNYNDNEMLIDDNISLNQVSENTKNSYKIQILYLTKQITLMMSLNYSQNEFFAN